ncbi:hypothetical protein F0562_022074 [Nyssa sinensis]|uniref:Uncharacterized protein n=1 Tax=Nyssa sinensis TaxID=561372 RepID=A0A5J5BLM9_9ASTE|nr:hypothetical protein F0562_022074 [Nyssa sinensis]
MRSFLSQQSSGVADGDLYLDFAMMGTVEIITPVELIKKGDKCSVLRCLISEDDLSEKFAAGVSMITSL